MTKEQLQLSAFCNYGHEPMPAKCHMEDECGFSPQPAYCSMTIHPPIQPVPEPMTWMLFAIGLVIIGLINKIRNKNAI